jgi:uncharacterized membrane protein
MTLTFAFLIGFMAGLRSLTPPAAAAWAAHLGWLKLQGGLAVMESLTAVANFTILAALELVADKWPKLPARTAGFALVARMLTGALAGACVAQGGGGPALAGAALGAIGGAAGGFGGYLARRELARALRLPDFWIALAEDAICVAGCAYIVTRFA